jgi:hypothetical protein
MKKITLIFTLLLAIAGFTRAQVIENFESIKMNMMAGGADDLSSFTIVANPDTAGPANINKSTMVCKFMRDKDGVPWGGFWSPQTTPVDLTTNKYIHCKVWKPRISPVKVKIQYQTNTGTALETASMNPQTVINGWEELVFDMSSVPEVFDQFNFMPDFADPVGLTDDITIYFDDFYVNNDPTVGSAPVQVIEDFEHIPLNLMLGGAEDQSALTQIPNPYPTGINVTTNVMQLLRDKDGVAWCGFWSPLPTPVDVTTNKYVHVKVWKPRISPVKFKLEGGAAGTLEIASMNTQTLTNAWEDFVFDFSGKTGTYPIIAFMPDFIDPVGLTDDITIYFDDILVNNDPTPIAPTVKTINVDMHGSKLAEGQQVFISGDFGGAYGTWAQPGTIAGNEMFDLDGDSIYSITIVVPDAVTYQFKFFKGADWSQGDDGPGNRFLYINGNVNITYKWGVKASNLTLNVDMHGSGLAAGQKVYFAGDFGGDYGSWNAPGTNLNNMMTDTDGDSVYTAMIHLGQVGTFHFKFFKGDGWDGGEWAGDPNRDIKIVLGDTTATYNWGEKPQAISENQLVNKVSVYPVPFSNKLTFNTLVDVKSVVITTSYGQQVARFENPATGRTTINTSDLPSGMYFVTFTGKNGDKLTKKIIK